MPLQAINKPVFRPVEIVETLLRGAGAWCSMVGAPKKTHYFVAKNPKIDTAISLCGQYVKTFNKLHIVEPSNTCLACELFAKRREGTGKNHPDELLD